MSEDWPAIQVTPIFGCGWVVGGRPRFQVPEPFTVKLDGGEATRWTGVVLDCGHEFEGRRVSLSQRHIEWAGHVNIAVEGDEATVGFGMLAERPPNINLQSK